MVGSLLAAALGAALYRFAGVAPAPIVLATAVIGLVVGLTLPPARPELHRRARPALSSAVDALTRPSRRSPAVAVDAHPDSFRP